MAGKRIADIEVLRAIAVLGVVFHHAFNNLFAWATPDMQAFRGHFQFWWGVDLFFAISGFVIARDLLPRLATAQENSQFWRTAGGFWIRRAGRLLPSAWLWLLLPLAAVALFNQSGVFGDLRTNLMATLAGIGQFANFRFADSFMSYDYGVTFVYWSLALEEQFYLVLPLLALLLRRWLPWFLIALVVVQFFQLRTPLLMVLRTDAIALGVLLAVWSHSISYRRFEPRLIGRHWLLGLTLLISLGTLLAWLSSANQQWLTYRIGLIAMFSAILVLIASYDRNYLLPAGILQRLMLWIGSRSYAIYLIHIPAFFLTRELWFRLSPEGTVFGPAHMPGFTITALLLIVVASELNYRLIEMPLRTRGVRLAERIEARNSSNPSNGVTTC